MTRLQHTVVAIWAALLVVVSVVFMTLIVDRLAPRQPTVAPVAIEPTDEQLLAWWFAGDAGDKAALRERMCGRKGK